MFAIQIKRPATPERVLLKKNLKNEQFLLIKEIVVKMTEKGTKEYLIAIRTSNLSKEKMKMEKTLLIIVLLF